MCGLVGVYSSNMFNRHKECFSSLLYLDTWRGRDSTGVAAIRGNTAATAIYKSTVPGYEFIEQKRFEEHLKLNDFCWIGHNRYGTIGKNIRSNAHPFEVLNDHGQCILVGAHNGTLKNKHVLANHGLFGTDSEAMFNSIATIGVEETIKLLDGAWAIVYYDHREEALCFLRNKERSLFYAYEEGRKTIIWASEAWMLRAATDRADIKLDDGKVYSFVEDTLYKFPAPAKMNDELKSERKGGLVGKQALGFFQRGWEPERWRNEQAVASICRTQPQTTPQTPAKSAAEAAAVIAEALAAKEQLPPLNSNSQSGSPNNDSGEKPRKKNESSSKRQPKSGAQDNVTDIDTAKRYKGYGGLLYTKKQIENALAGGCAFCERTFISIEDKHGWLSKDKPVCVKCLEGGHEIVETEAKEVTVH